MPLDRATLSAIGHAGLPFWSPVTVSVLDRLLDRLVDATAATRRLAHTLDLGCGDGAMLVHTTGRLGGVGMGVDRDPAALALARRHPGPFRWYEAVPSPQPGEEPPDLLLAVGSVAPADLPSLPLRPRALLVGELVALGAAALPGLPPPGLRGLTDDGWELVDAVLLGEPDLRAYEAHWLGNVRAWAQTRPYADLAGTIAAHEAILEAGGLGFELTAWVARSVNPEQPGSTG